jgi:putative transposase
MPAHKAFPIELSSAHDRELKAQVRARSTPQKLAERATIILLSATGVGVDETVRRLGVRRKTASTWRRRWLDADVTAGVAARLSDAPRSGAPATFTPRSFAGSSRCPVKTPKRLRSQSVIGVRANSPVWRFGVASSRVSRTARLVAF